MAGFENLDVWKRAVALSADVYRKLAKCSDYGFRDQITCLDLCGDPGGDAGAARKTALAARRVRRALRANQFRTQAVVGTKAGLIESAVSEVRINESREISAMIQGLIRSLKTSG